MEKKEFIEIGKIINTHGVLGEVKIEPWSDSIKTFKGIKTYYIDGKPFVATKVRDFNQFVLIKFEEVKDMNEALKIKNKVLFVKRSDLKIEEGKILRCDIIGLPVIDKNTNTNYGIVKDILDYPAHSIFVIDYNNKEVLLPNVSQFVNEINDKCVYITPIEGFFE